MPPAITATTNYLVVEGVIGTGQDSTIIKLSRTVNLDSAVGSKPELHASVKIQSDANDYYALPETGNGFYKTPPLNLSSSNKYKLIIATADNKQYQSDFVIAKNSPPIDSVYYRVNNSPNSGVQIYADTHDPANNTIYYRWNFEETWMIHSAFQSFLKLVRGTPDTIVFRPPSEQIYTCWQSALSTNISINTTERLSQDVVTDNRIIFVPSTSEKISNRYSILVRQYALTKEAYSYWTQLKKNTEQLGSIFDPQPSAASTNIHCITTRSEPVIGYISAGASSTKRIFIDTRDLPAWLPIYPYAACMKDTLYYHGRGNVNEVENFIYRGGQIPISVISFPGVPPRVIGYSAGDPDCIDCTLRGTNQQPAFWTNR